MLRNARSVLLLRRCAECLSTATETGLGFQSFCVSPGLDTDAANKLSLRQLSTESFSHKSRADIPLVKRYLPQRFLPYAELMRWDKPSAAWLLAWPCFWSIALAAPCGEMPDLYALGLFGAGAMVMRSAGCTINDMWDRDIDKRVERTSDRPLASGALSVLDAWGLLGLQLSVGLGVLLQLNDYSKVLGASSLLLVITYPLMKRHTYWPQMVLGLAMNWGALLGYAAVKGSCDLPIVLPLYGAGVAWTIVYDTIYACQDVKDDKKIGLKSTPLLFGDNIHAWLAGFSLITIAGFSLAGAAANCGLPYYTGVLGVGAHLAYQVLTLKVHNGPDCMAKFTSNKWLGAVLFSGILLDKLACVPPIPVTHLPM